MSVTAPALRYHGAKFRLAPWVMQFFPPHVTYVEPFGGAAGVLLQKPRSYSEVYGDLDGEICNFFQVLRDPEMRSRLIEAVMLTPYSREEFEGAWEPSDDPVEQARRTAVRAQMGFGSAGATKGATGFRVDSAREYATAAHLWARYPDALAAVGERFAGVLVECAPAEAVMRQHDRPDTLHFVDPPYVLSTRVMQGGGRGYYRHEMTDADHVALLQVLRRLQGLVVVCGYDCDLYREMLGDWDSYQTSARISASRGSARRVETLWVNPACAEALVVRQQALFGRVG